MLDQALPGIGNISAAIVVRLDGDKVVAFFIAMQRDQLETARTEIKFIVGAEFAAELILANRGVTIERVAVHGIAERILAPDEVERAKRQVHVGDRAVLGVVGQRGGKVWLLAGAVEPLAAKVQQITRTVADNAYAITAVVKLRQIERC